jgi:hypothetical protein
MQELPKLNNVAVDDEPEPKPKLKRDLVPYCIFFAVISCRLILSCGGVSAPIITSWRSWGLTMIIILLAGTIVDRIGKKWYSVEIAEKIHEYYICTSVSLLTFLTFPPYYTSS